MVRSRGWVAGAAAALGLLSACEQGPLPPAGAQPEPEVRRQSLGSAFAQCTIDTGFDPESAPPESGLAEDEQAWRDCAYAAMERVLGPDLRAQPQLDALIAQDRRLTADIAAGTATRQARDQALDDAVAALEAEERTIRAEETSELSAAELLSSLRSNAETPRVLDEIQLIGERL